MTNECIFCRISAGDADGSFVHRDEQVGAFLDIRPVTPGHLLVIPNEHVEAIHDVPDATANRMFSLARRLAKTLREGDIVKADGVNLFAADGDAAGQDVFHAHLHVIPRFTGDGFEIEAAAWAAAPPTRAELDRQAGAIRAVMSRTDAAG